MVSIAVIPILLVIAVIPPVLAPDSDPAQFIQNIIPSFKVACAGLLLCDFIDNGVILEEVGTSEISCLDTGCREAGGICEVDFDSVIVDTADENGVPFCVCRFPAVGGWFLQVDQPTLLVAGAQNTAAWMIPVIVSGIGIAIVIARKF